MEDNNKPAWLPFDVPGWIKCGQCLRHMLKGHAITYGCTCGNKYQSDEITNLNNDDEDDTAARESAAENIMKRLLISFGGTDPVLIFDHVYLGRYILNVSKEVEDNFPGEFVYKRISVMDLPTQNLYSHFDEAHQFIVEAKNKGKNVLIHCAAGASRSATIVISYLMKYHKMKLNDALKHVKKLRPIVNPNAGFISQLVRFEKTLLEGTTTSTNPS